MNGQGTDSGGGGTELALEDKIKRIDLANDHYLVGVCSLNNVQIFCNATEFALGREGQNPDGSYKQNVMQMCNTYTFAHVSWDTMSYIKQV
eukprot:13352624-Ditylum_brightwellii.AAC.1